MFGDIITDIGAMIQGGLGLAPCGNINPDGVSNPIATIWAGALLLADLGEDTVAETVLRAGKVKTCDLGFNSSTSEVGDAIVIEIKG